MTKRLDAHVSAEKWGRNLGAASQSATEGVNAVTEAPQHKAARKKTKWLRNVTAAVNKWEKSLLAQSLPDWVGPMIRKGIPHMVEAAGDIGGMEAALAKLFPELEQALTRLARMPDDTYAERKARQGFFSDFMHDLATKRGGGRA